MHFPHSHAAKKCLYMNAAPPHVQLGVVHVLLGAGLVQHSCDEADGLHRLAQALHGGRQYMQCMQSCERRQYVQYMWAGAGGMPAPTQGGVCAAAAESAQQPRGIQPSSQSRRGRPKQAQHQALAMSSARMPPTPCAYCLRGPGGGGLAGHNNAKTLERLVAAPASLIVAVALI